MAAIPVSVRRDYYRLQKALRKWLMKIAAFFAKKLFYRKNCLNEFTVNAIIKGQAEYKKEDLKMNFWR